MKSIPEETWYMNLSNSMDVTWHDEDDELLEDEHDSGGFVEVVKIEAAWEEWSEDVGDDGAVGWCRGEDDVDDVCGMTWEVDESIGEGLEEFTVCCLTHKHVLGLMSRRILRSFPLSTKSRIK